VPEVTSPQVGEVGVVHSGDATFELVEHILLATEDGVWDEHNTTFLLRLKWVLNRDMRHGLAEDGYNLRKDIAETLAEQE
jgi:hypothetical protein